MKSLPAAFLAASSFLCAAAHAEFTTDFVPDFRGDESTAYFGWTDWDQLAGGLALPDDPASTHQDTRLFPMAAGPLVGPYVDQLCVAPAAPRFGIGHTAPVGRHVLEVVVQIQGTGVADAEVVLAYSNGFDPDYLAPVEIVELAPGERMFRFLAAPDGLPIGTFGGDITSFQLEILLVDGPLAVLSCLDAVRLDVRHDLEGSVPASTIGCTTNANSLLVRAGIDAGGSSDVADNDLRLTASGIRPGSFGIFLTSRDTANVACPGGCGVNGGVLCLGGSIGRYGTILEAGADMSFALDVDLDAMPVWPSVAAQAGETWYFQAWFRDGSPVPLPPQPASNLTNPIGLMFR